MKNTEIECTEVVDFNHSKMVCPIINNEPYVLVKSIVEGIGLNYENALANLRNSKFNTYCCEYNIMSEKYGDILLSNLKLNYGYSYLAIPVRKIAAWLYSINPNKVGKEAKPILLKFQERCDDVLFQYFFGRKELDIVYFDEKKELLKQKRNLDVKIKSLRTAIFETTEGKELNQTEIELKKVKSKLQKLEQKQFGMIYNLFDQQTEKIEIGNLT